MSEDTIVATFDTPAHAALAEQDLLAAGVAAGAVSLHAAGSRRDAGGDDGIGAAGATAVELRIDEARASEAEGILASHRPVAVEAARSDAPTTEPPGRG